MLRKDLGSRLHPTLLNPLLLYFLFSCIGAFNIKVGRFYSRLPGEVKHPAENSSVFVVHLRASPTVLRM
jgi:hypothetical protein